MLDMKLAAILGKSKAYLRARIEELETNSKNKNIRGISDFKRGTSLNVI